jgi:cation:H+ antiporter
MVVLLSGGALVLYASVRLTHGLDRLRELLGLSEGLLGLLTAIGANTPEIAAAVTALVSGAHEVGYGLVLGSNLFNLAGLLGLSAALIGKVEQDRVGLLLHGSVAVVTTLAAAGLVMGWFAPLWTLVALLAVMTPYVAVLALAPAPLRRLPRPGAEALAASLYREGAGCLDEPSDAPGNWGPVNWGPVWMILPSLAAILGGSVEMVRSALRLGQVWHVPAAVTGALVLAALTGLPNVYAALRLARQGRGGAVVSETLNSNTLNLLIGITIPALVFGLGRGGSASVLEVWWLLVLTLVALLLMFCRSQLPRWGGAVIIALYLAFVAVRLVQS